MATGTSTPSPISSISRFLVALCLTIFMDASRCTSSANGTVNFQFSKNQWKHKLGQTDKCPSLFEGGAKQLQHGVQLPLTHIYGPCSPLRPKNLSRAGAPREILERDGGRMRFIRPTRPARVTPSTVVPVGPGIRYDTGLYVATVAVGTPAQQFIVVVDTASSITWIQCEPCVECYPQVDPIFDPRGSTSYGMFRCHSPECDELQATGRRLPCRRNCLYGISYRDGSVTAGSFGRETLRLGSDSFRDFKMGCGHSNTGRFKSAAGILALGRGPFSLPAQTAGKYRQYFSYCLPRYTDPGSVGWLRLGPSAVASSPGVIYTSMLPNPSSNTLYFVGLLGISVGGRRLRIPDQVFLRGGGTVVDSGAPCTSLVPAAYQAFRAAFLEGTAHLPRAPAFGPLDTCYNVTGLPDFDIPTVELHFQDSATVKLEAAGTVMFVRKAGSTVCLAFRASPDGVNVIGSFQQQGFTVMYDLPNARIGFAREPCRTAA